MSQQSDGAAPGDLVDQEGLSARIHAGAGGGAATRSALAAGRAAYETAARFFPHILVTGVGVAIVLVFLQGMNQPGRTGTVDDGLALMGTQIKNALVLGAIYALVAIGYTMVYGIIELINFAHGDVFTLSGFYASIIAGSFGAGLTGLSRSGTLAFLLAMVLLFSLSMLGAGLTGMAIERVAYRRLRDAPRLAPLITAIGVSFLLEGFMLVKFGADNVPTEQGTWITGTALTIGSVTVDWKDVFVVAVALGLMFSLGGFVRGTRLGKAMRATAQDRSAALLCGINVNATIAATFFIGSALAAAGAIAYSIQFNEIQWSLGYRLGIIAFTAAVLGGIGNIVGAGIGGFLIGIIYVFGGQLIGGQWSESLIFAVLVIILTFRPVGLFGVDVTSRA